MIVNQARAFNVLLLDDLVVMTPGYGHASVHNHGSALSAATLLNRGWRGKRAVSAIRAKVRPKLLDWRAHPRRLAVRSEDILTSVQ